MEQPETIEKALKDKNWKEAADSEYYQSLMDNETWKLVKLPAGRKPIGCKWIFKTKRTSDGKVEHYKAKLVAKGYTKNPEKINTVVTAFLNRTINEEIYIEQPPGYIKKEEKDLV